MLKKHSSVQDNSVSDEFIFVPESPVLSINQRGNLTGNVRIIRDHVIDMGDLIQQWNTELIAGMIVISDIKTMIKNTMKTKGDNEKEKLKNLSKELEKICDRMNMVVDKLKHKSLNIESIKKLEELNKFGKSLFMTWPVTKFVETSRNVYNMFKNEMKMKLLIKEEICFCIDENALVFLLSAWSYQPYVEKSINLNFKAMLREVNHVLVECI